MAEPVVRVTFDAYLERWAAGHGGYDPRGSLWARPWLRGTYALGVPLARAGVSPHAVTLAGLVLCGLVAVFAVAGWPVAAACALVLSGLLDSLDGAVAILTGRVTRFGYVLDSVADRAGEVLYVAGLWALGAPGWLCVLAGTGAWLLEYTRARATGAGMTEIGVVTVWERATRIAVTAAGLLLTPWVPVAPTVTAGVWAALGPAALVQLLVVVHRRLAPPPQPPPPR